MKQGFWLVWAPQSLFSLLGIVWLQIVWNILFSVNCLGKVCHEYSVAW